MFVFHWKKKKKKYKTVMLFLSGSGVISMICGGQILAYCLFKDNFIYPVLDDF